MSNKPSRVARSLQRLVVPRVWVVECDDFLTESVHVYPFAYTTEEAAQKRAARLEMKDAKRDEYATTRYRVLSFEVVGARHNKPELTDAPDKTQNSTETQNG